MAAGSTGSYWQKRRRELTRAATATGNSEGCFAVSGDNETTVRFVMQTRSVLSSWQIWALAVDRD